MEKKEKIKLRIRALLAKTTENGASKEEAVSAMAKAQKLMSDYYIQEGDLNDPFLGETPMLKVTERHKSAYNMTGFYFELSELFDCVHYYTTDKVTFFGFETDVELCIYFTHFITNACLAEKAKFIKSEDYKHRKRGYHGRTLVAAFVRGFIDQVAFKMQEMYEDRRRERSRSENQQNALVIVKKKNKVEKAFKELGVKIYTAYQDDSKRHHVAYHIGAERGDSLDINQGVKDSKKTPLLS